MAARLTKRQEMTIAATAQRLVEALHDDECGHVLGSIHSGTCPVCRALAELLVAISAEVAADQQLASLRGAVEKMKDAISFELQEHSACVPNQYSTDIGARSVEIIGFHRGLFWVNKLIADRLARLLSPEGHAS